MRMTRTMTSALVIAAIAVSTPVVAASPAAAVGCSLAGVNHLFGRTVNLWNCDGAFHGQIQGAQGGDVIELQERSFLRWFGTRFIVVQPGSTTANTGAIFGDAEHFRACLYIGDRPGESVCT